jgi:hypothetical protein
MSSSAHKCREPAHKSHELAQTELYKKEKSQSDSSSSLSIAAEGIEPPTLRV